MGNAIGGRGTFGWRVWRVVAGNSFTHEEEHIAHIRAWLPTA
ncbi:MAG TPA: hypothetical protein VJN88_17280 [Ktedonobacterales bacterium]|nr:hypothetical protein [Ktedonobacterales bacterium]